MRTLKTLSFLFLTLFIVTAFVPHANAQEADLLVTKDVAPESDADTDVTYTVTVTNLGPDTATGVTLDDPIPAGMTFVSATTDPDFSCSTPNPGDTSGSVNCTANGMTAGDVATFTLVYHIPSGTPPGTSFTNIATVSSAADPNEENNQASATTSTPPPPQGDAGVVKEGPPGAGPDEDVTYVITVNNAGPDDAQNVTLTDNIPGDMTFVSFTQDAGPTFSCSTPAVGAGGTVSCSLAMMPAGSSATFTLVTHVPAGTPAGTTYENMATVSADSDPNEENNLSATTLTVSAADLAIQKTGPATASAGSDVAYTISVTNNGPDSAFDVTWTDTVPAGATFVSLTYVSGPLGVCAFPFVGTTGTAACNYASFPSGATSVYTLTVEPGNVASITNTATVSFPGSDSDGTNNNSTVITTVTPAVDLAVVKSGPATVTAGTNVTYTITLTNNGPSTASTVALTDTLPANGTLVSFTRTSGPAFTCVSTTCTAATMAPNTTATFSLVVAVDPNAANGSSFDNTVAVTTSTTELDNSNNSSTSPATVAASANLGVTKSGPATANAGANVTYTITVTNAGPSTAANVSLSDTPPANTTFVSMTQTSGPTFSCIGTVTCTIASLAPAQTATFDLVLNINAATANGTVVSNTATVSTTTSDPSSSNDSATANTTVASVADLAVTKTGPATANADTDVTYTITVTNNGPSDATNVSLSDTPPANTTFVSMTQTTGPTFNCTGTVTCTIATLVPGATATFDLILHVNASAPGGSSIANTATVTAATSDSNTANNSSTATTVVTALADVGVQKIGPATANAGANMTYTITVTNPGPSIAANVTLTDALPVGTTFISMTQTSGPTFNCTGTVTCTLAAMPAASTATFDLVVRIDPAAAETTALSNTANVTSTTSDPNTLNNTSTATTIVTVLADVSVVKSGPAVAGADTNATYTITVTNNGPSNAGSISLTDVIPASTTFVSMTQTSGPTFSCTNPSPGGTGTVTCTLGLLLAGTTATFDLVVHVDAVAPDGTVITNTANVTSITPDGNTGNNTSTTTTNVAAVADLVVTKTGPARPEANTDITYVITLTNNGPSTATSVTLTDVLPAQTTFVSITQTTGPTFSCTTPAAGATGTVTCTVAALASGTTATFNLVVHVSAQAFGTLENTATATSPNDPTAANNAGTASAAIATVPIPTLSTWMLIFLALSLGIAAVFVQRH